MYRNLLFLSVFVISNFCIAQGYQNDYAISLRAGATPLLNEHTPGGQITFQYYFHDNFSIGSSAVYTASDYSKGFRYPTNKTIVRYFGLNAPLQYDFVNTSKLQLGVGLAFGIGFATLLDKLNYGENDYWDFNENIYYEYGTPKKLTRDTFFTVSPSLNVLYRIFEIDREDRMGVYLSANVGYQTAIGNRSFGESSDFNNVAAFLGLTFKGPF